MERVFKVVMIGGVGSGKTSLRNYLLYGNYTGKYTPTTNSDFVSTHITLSSQEMIAIQIWDTCESSSELLTTHSLLQDADGVMLVCDGANSASLQALERHLPAIDTISKSRRGGLPVMLVRTKSDMVGADGERLNAGCKASKEFCLQRLCVDDIRLKEIIAALTPYEAAVARRELLPIYGEARSKFDIIACLPTEIVIKVFSFLSPSAVSECNRASNFV
ncbi:hypothetical protein GGI04_000034 [Coemansia thaxteri]|nr:hypothetical protein GGI04_000034 [Coemansia thaxteri]